MEKINLKHRITLEFTIDGPFSFEKTFYSPSRFPSKLELFEGDCFYIALNFDDNTFGLKVFPNDKKLCVDIYFDHKLKKEILKKITEELRFRFSLDMDYSEFYDNYTSDEFLKKVIERNYGKRIASIYSLYENLIISIFLQNATVQRTISMCNNMLLKYGKLISFDSVELYAMWDTKDFSPTEEELRNLKVGYRANSIIRVTEHFKKGSVSEQKLRSLSTDSLEKELLKIYGVGKQTVFYTIGGQFHKTGYLKHIPLWERKIFSKYIFDNELCEEKEIVRWFHSNYGNWSGFTLSMILEDIFYQHKNDPIPWLKEIMREK